MIAMNLRAEFRCFAVICLSLHFAVSSIFSQEPAPPPAAPKKPAPKPAPKAPSLPPTAYALEDAFPGARFSKPLAIASPPGENARLFVVEQTGSIQVLDQLDRRMLV